MLLKRKDVKKTPHEKLGIEQYKKFAYEEKHEKGSKEIGMAGVYMFLAFLAFLFLYTLYRIGYALFF